jgi:hypothetical protein
VYHHHHDHFSKNILRDALSMACAAETEVEVLAAAQKIDVYVVPDPARAAALGDLGLLGALAAEPSLFEPFHDTPNLWKVRRCLNKQHAWHHELERRARVSVGPPREGGEEPAPEVPFPALVVIGPGVPATVLDAYACQEVEPGVYHGVWGLALRVVVLSELPRTRETLLLRLLGKGPTLRDALADLAKLPEDAWERSIVTPLLVHFQLIEHATTEEDTVSAEIRAWFEEYQRKLRSEAHHEGVLEGRHEGLLEGLLEGREEGRAEGERRALLRLLRVRFGDLPPEMIARVEVANLGDLERWGARLFAARTLDEVLDDPSRPEPS